MSTKLILCDCLGSQSPDADVISRVTGLECAGTLSDACGKQIDHTARLMQDGDVMIACQQMARLFSDLADEVNVPTPAFVDLRDRAGWSEEATAAQPKTAALVAEALLPRPAEKTLDISSEGLCLITGPAEAALAAAAELSATLPVTVLTDTPGTVDPAASFDVVAGSIGRATGSLGRFSLRIDAFRQPVHGGRGDTVWTEPRDGAMTECDILLDLSGDAPRFSAHEKRDGYLRADPRNPADVSRALLEAAQLTGTFEKPLYVRLEASLCAHSRAEKPACSKCLNVCPTGAITSAGEHVAIDPLICAGCGACSALCPSGAITYDAPPVATVFSRLNTLASTFRKAGGTDPRLLVHDAHGGEMISLAARWGRGLPADVIPLEVNALAGFGHAEMLAALACGFTSVSILPAPKTERAVVQSEMDLANAVSGGHRVRLLDLNDPDALSDALYNAERPALSHDPVLPMGTRRQVTRLAAKTLQPDAELLALPAEAPYGAVLVDTDACTLCLACVSLCPSGALGDNADLPQLRFQEDACLQCGLCSNVCPEKAITLEPRLNLTDEAFSQKVLHEEEPFACVECGTLFGTKSTVERIMEKLAGNHHMFATTDAARMIQMCDNCRIQAQFHSENNPFSGGEKPKVRTTDDYLSKRRDH
ncbi:4Fe-4S binding protein [uncultured Roseobacter sp.]|uniref:4Fe-4S binding protein n=1 Tax=uncultured Roseobacter sp. TaxID=114847 RepID=UPI00260D9A63|nr:4Fe-4S binding protein [uncultured Roseobacter sp.]